MFRLENKVPEVYVDSSRDFQLLCRLYDVVFNSSRYSIDSMVHLTSSQNCDIRVLELLKTKVGLFSTFYATETELRFLIDAFPTIIRYKGSKRGVSYITMLYARMYPSVVAPKCAYKEGHHLELTFSDDPQNPEMIKELLKYVLPTGYALSLVVSKHRSLKTRLYTTDELVYVNATKSAVHELNQIGGSDTVDEDSKTEFHLGPTMGTAIVINPLKETEDT